MKRATADSRMVSLVCGLLMMMAARVGRAEEPSAAAVHGFDAYVSAVEARLALQHRSRNFFLAGVESEPRLRDGELQVERVGGQDLPAAMLHHWRGTAFSPGAKAADFERVMRDFGAYPQSFAPEVVRAGVAGQGDRVQASMRVRQRHVVTVVMDATYDVTFGRLDAERGYSFSRSTRIAEVEDAGTRAERVLSTSEAHGFLWRMNTYWSYEERDGGLYVQVETVSLTRAVPRGLGWVVGPFVDSVPRESMEFTLRAVCAAVRERQGAGNRQ